MLQRWVRRDLPRCGTRGARARSPPTNRSSRSGRGPSGTSSPSSLNRVASEESVPQPPTALCGPRARVRGSGECARDAPARNRGSSLSLRRPAPRRPQEGLQGAVQGDGRPRRHQEGAHSQRARRGASRPAPGGVVAGAASASSPNHRVRRRSLRFRSSPARVSARFACSRTGNSTYPTSCACARSSHPPVRALRRPRHASARTSKEPTFFSPPSSPSPPPPRDFVSTPARASAGQETG